MASPHAVGNSLSQSWKSAPIHTWTTPKPHAKHDDEYSSSMDEETAAYSSVRQQGADTDDSGCPRWGCHVKGEE